MSTTYQPVRNMPICKFYYKGNHSHYVRRTILRIPAIRSDLIAGYELREGSTVRTLKNAPVKTYKKDKIAKWDQIGKGNHKTPGEPKTTLKKMNLIEFMLEGA